MLRKLLFAGMAVMVMTVMGQTYTVSATKYHPGMGGQDGSPPVVTASTMPS